MNIKVFWPGKTQNDHIRNLEALYIQKIKRLAKCQVIATKAARGIPEKHARRIKDIEASGLEKHIENDFVVCLSDKGKEVSSSDLAEFLDRLASGPERFVTFIVGGFLGLDDRIIKRANFNLSLSRMTFSHEMSRIMLLEQIYRSLSIIKGYKYAK
jgi:23S rRNA (pseudouridine1915-N3)-methyltransferase